jgi:8-amino-7-oxononanoate synthase
MTEPALSVPARVWDLERELEVARVRDLYRSRRVIEGPPGVEAIVEGRRLLSFCSNDYLGLAGDPRVVAALRRGADRYGVGSGAAHLMSGHTAAHHALEEELAAFVDRPRALLFSTGYMANLGVVSVLLGRDDAVFEDRRNHASLLDGGLLSRARFRRYPHADAQALGGLLVRSASRRKLVVSDGVFSMDGDLAPLPELLEVVSRHGAWLMVDDAHGLGVLGGTGRGTLEHFALSAARVPILVGTLGKAFGTFGAFVAGETDLVELLIQRARTYIFTTAPPPAVAEATRVSLRLAQTERWRRERLADLLRRFRRRVQQLGLPLLDSPTPIQPLVLGRAALALAWSRALEARGLLVPAVRPPTVPEAQSRLRITISAAHTAEQVDRLLEGLEACGRLAFGGPGAGASMGPFCG